MDITRIEYSIPILELCSIAEKLNDAPLGYDNGYKPKKERGLIIQIAWPDSEIEFARRWLKKVSEPVSYGVAGTLIIILNTTRNTNSIMFILFEKFIKAPKTSVTDIRMISSFCVFVIHIL
jgi:hypothetical protein